MNAHGSRSRRHTRQSARKSSETLNGKLADADTLVGTTTRTGRTRRAQDANYQQQPTLNPDLAQNVSSFATASPGLPPKAGSSPENKTRKWQSTTVGNDVADEPSLKRVRLTRENLARFNNKDGTGIGASSVRESPAGDDAVTAETPETTVSSFIVKAEANGMRLDRSEPPTNLGDMRAQCSRRRGSVSATESDFKRYRLQVLSAATEATIIVHTSQMLLKNYGHDKHDNKEHEDNDEDNESGGDEEEDYGDMPYLQAFNQRFTCFPKEAGFNDGLKPLQPDFIEGLDRWEFRPFPIDDVKGAVIGPGQFSIALPHLAGEWKENGKNMDTARIQSAYDGAALVFGRTRALEYLGKSDPPGHAKTITFTFDGDILNIFAHYASLTKTGKVEYHQYPIGSYLLLRSYEEFETGRRALRNVQDYARKQAMILRNRLRRYTKKHEKLVCQGLGTRVAPSPQLPKRGRGRPPKRGGFAQNNAKAVPPSQQQEVGSTARKPKRRGRPLKQARGRSEGGSQ